MSVDTNTKNKNLAPYRKLRHGDLKILVSPQLPTLASVMRVDVRGGLRKTIRIEFQE